MFEIQAENRDLTDRDINQPKETHKKGLLLGTDFRHAVEFSRSGRTTTPAPAGFVVGGSPTLPRLRSAPPKGPPGRPPGPRGASRTIHDLGGPCTGVLRLPGEVAQSPRRLSIPTVRPGCPAISRTASRTPGMKEARS